MLCVLSGRCTDGSDSDGRVSDGQQAGRVPAFVHLSRVEGEGGLRSGGGWLISAALSMLIQPSQGAPLAAGDGLRTAGDGTQHLRRCRSERVAAVSWRAC
jgi:hypothetical protein